MPKRKVTGLYVSRREYKEIYGGKSEKINKIAKAILPFNYCELSLKPINNGVCTRDGHIFDIINIIPYIKKYGTNPINNKKLNIKDLIKIKFHKNTDNLYCCPITYKIFNEHSHIVVISTSGHVYSMDAIQEMNIKQKNWHDLITNERFTRADIITLQDPNKIEERVIDKFKDIKKKRQKINNSNDKNKNAPRSRETTHHFAASFTSTALTPQTKNIRALLTPKEIRSQWYDMIKKDNKAKALIRMHTNFGNLNFVLHCNLVPSTCHNFLELCKKKYYDNTIFHRLIKGFMIQGGDPTGNGTGGQTAWDDELVLADEFHNKLKHHNRGVLSMANSGSNTNKSQFFITFGACQWLDNKHSVFGELVGGNDVLTKIEQQRTKDKDRPINDIILKTITIYKSPFNEPFEAKDELDIDKETRRLHKLRQELSSGHITRKEFEELSKTNSQKQIEDDRVQKWYSAPLNKQNQSNNNNNNNNNNIGKYLPDSQLKLSKTKKKSNKNMMINKNKNTYGNFDSW